MNDKTQGYGRILLVAVLLIAMSVAFVGIGAADKTETLNDGDRYWEGQVLEHTFADGIEDAEVVKRNDDETFVTELNVQNGDTVSIDTQGYDSGPYKLVYQNASATTDDEQTVNFSVSSQTMSVDVEDVRVLNDGDASDTQTEFTFESNRNNYYVNISADNLSDADLAQVFSADESDVDDGQLNRSASSGEIDADFDGIDADSYDFTFEVVDTGVTDSASVTVAEPGDALVEFDESYVNVAEGDYTDITLTFEETDSAHVVIGDDDEVGYQIEFDVTDTEENGEVTIVFNTYLAGQSEDNDVDLEDIVYVHEDSEGDVSFGSETELTDRQLASASYDMSVFADDSTGDETDVGALDITERSSTGVTSMVLPGDTDVDDYEDVEEAVSESNTVAENDTLVLEVEMNGIYGFFDDTSTLTSNATDNNGLYAELVREQPNRQTSVDVTNADIYTNSDDGVFYIVFDVDSSEFTIDADYDVEVGLTTDNPYVDEDEDEETFELTVSTEERNTEFTNLNSDDVVEVEQGDNLEVTAETNVADGTERRVTVRKTGENSFVKNVPVTSEDGEFTATFTEDRLSLGATFTVQVREETSQVDAVIVESTVTDVDDGADDEDGTDDDDGADDEDGEDNTTEDDTPGFGALVALVALIGAALLALRRDN